MIGRLRLWWAVRPMRRLFAIPRSVPDIVVAAGLENWRWIFAASGRSEDDLAEFLARIGSIDAVLAGQVIVHKAYLDRGAWLRDEGVA